MLNDKIKPALHECVQCVKIVNLTYEKKRPQPARNL